MPLSKTGESVRRFNERALTQSVSLIDVKLAGDAEILPVIDAAANSKLTTINTKLSATPLNIAKGNISGTTFIHKFGIAPDFDTGDNEVDVWDGANDASPDLMTYTYSTSADIDRISSSAGADTENIEIQGLDTDYNFVTQTITLTGQTAATLSTSLIRVFRMRNIGSTDLVGTCYCFVNVATTGGIPDTLANIRAMIAIGNGQTLMTLYTIPNGKKGYMLSFYGATIGASMTSNYQVKLYDKPFGQVFTLEESHALVEDGTSHFNHKYGIPTLYTAKTDLIMTVQVTAGAITAATVGCGFELIIVDD